MKLDARLKAVLEEVKGAERVVDVGADHGKICAGAVYNGYAAKAAAIDISEKSLAKARNLAERIGVADKMEFIAADGADFRWETSDTLVIAGLGGEEILHIIRGKNRPKKAVLVAHQDAPVLRKGLNDAGWFAEKDFVIVSGGKFYSLITVTDKGGKPFSEEEIFVGKNQPRSERFAESLEKRLEGIMRYYSRSVGEALKREKEIIENVLSR